MCLVYDGKGLFYQYTKQTRSKKFYRCSEISKTFLTHTLLPIPTAAPSNAWVFCRSLAGIWSLNPTGTWMSVS